MIAYSSTLSELALETQAFYRRAVQLLNEAEIPFLVGGAYALVHRTGIVRHTKDFDVFVREEDLRPALDVFARAGYRAELTFEHWLGKAFNGEDFVDFIFSSGNGVAKVDDLWFEHADPARFLGEPVLLCPVEETIWSKSFVCERERFDGADINHLIRACGRDLDWSRILWRFGSHWRVLMAHLMFFGFVYPTEQDAIPGWVLKELGSRLEEEITSGEDRRVCQGTLLSRVQYLIDLERWGYSDARLDPEAGMTARQVKIWTDAGLHG